MEECENDRSEVFGTGIDPTINIFTVPKEGEKMIKELASKGVLLTQYKQGSDYFRAYSELDKVVLEYDLDQLVRDGHHIVYKATGAITTETAIQFEYYRKAWDIYSKRILHDTADAQWTEQKEWKTTHNPNDEPGPEPEDAKSMDGNYTEGTKTEPDIEMDSPPESVRYCYECCEYICTCNKRESDIEMDNEPTYYEPKYEDRPIITFKEI